MQATARARPASGPPLVEFARLARGKVGSYASIYLQLSAGARRGLLSAARFLVVPPGPLRAQRAGQARARSAEAWQPPSRSAALAGR